jgi:hypothetical protein
MGKTLTKKKTVLKRQPARKLTKKSSVPDGTVQPTARQLQILERLADENRIPASWLNGTDDPTVAD